MEVFNKSSHRSCDHPIELSQDVFQTNWTLIYGEWRSSYDSSLRLKISTLSALIRIEATYMTF